MKIALLGDIALIGRYDITLDSRVDERVEYIKQLVKDCDYVIANQESVLTDKTRTIQCKGVYLRSSIENVKTLQYIGVTHVTLANNHIFDYGQRGMEDTVDTLTNAGIGYVGLCNEPIVLEKDCSRVMLDGFCCLTTNALRYGNSPGRVKLLTYETLDNYMQYAIEQGCIPIASVHYGIEGVHYPAEEHRELFRFISKHYNYILHGNHPHARQGLEKVNDSLLIYAQGNLCFDKCDTTSIHEVIKENAEKRKSYIVIIEINKNIITDYDVVPVTDLDSGILQEDIRGKEEILKFSEALNLTNEEISVLRRNELDRLDRNSSNRTLRFYLNRINIKYIGAYINGKIHAHKYASVLRNSWVK